MKEAQIFENWINNLSEGTWALPETPEQQEKLNQLMSAELIVGPDAINATEQLYDLVGDDELFDILNDLADKSQGRANCWDDSDVQRRLAELGIQTPQSTEAEPADVAQDTAPAQPAAAVPPVAEGDNMSTFVEDRELAEMLKYAGVSIKEGVLNDDTRNTWDHLLDRFRHEVEQFKKSGKLDDDLYDAVFDYYDQHGAMPYRVRNAKDGTVNQWISNRLSADLGIDEGVLGTVGGAALGSMLGGPVGAAAGAVGGQEMTKGGSSIIEGSCNMTMEGEYCPEHGLMECGSMEEDGGAVGMPYSMGENNEIVQNVKKLTDGWKGTLAGSAAGGLAGSAAGEALGPAAGAALGGAVGGLPGALAGAASGAAAGGAIGGAAGGLAGGKIGDKLGGPEETDEGSGTANIIKGAAKAATQGLADMSGSGKEIAKNLVYMEDDPINSNSAMTGSYYEGKETDIQEGDALLARIKSLALLR